MDINNSNAHEKLFKKTNYCSTGMNTVINRLVILCARLFFPNVSFFLVFLYMKIYRGQ